MSQQTNMTAVEWLFDNLNISGGSKDIKAFEQAKQMEKEQVELRYKDGTPMRKYNSSKLQAIENEISDDLLTEEEIAEFKRELKEVMKKPKTEISDEEIDNEAERYEKVDGVNSFKEAIKWYREQLRKK